MTVRLEYKDGRVEWVSIPEGQPYFRRAKLAPVSLKYDPRPSLERTKEDVIEFWPSDDVAFVLRPTGVSAWPIWKER